MNLLHRLIQSRTARCAVLLVAVLFHLVVCIRSMGDGRWITDDTVQYFRLASNLADHGVWSQAWTAPWVPDHQRTPGYPVLILLCLQSPLILIVVQHLMVLGTGWVIYAHLARKAGADIAAWAGILYILNPYAMSLASFGLTETACIFFMTLAWWQVAMLRNGQSMLIAALALTVASYLRPNALALAGIWVLWGGYALLRKDYRKASGMAFPGLAVILMMLPWMIRNHSITGRLSPSTVADIATVNGRMGGLFNQGLFPSETDLFHASDSVFRSRGLTSWKRYPGKGYFHENQIYTDEALRISNQVLIEEPGRTLSMLGRSSVQMFSGTGAGWMHAATGWRWIGLMAGGMQVLLSLTLLVRVAVRIRESGWGNALPVLAMVAALWIPALSLLADGRYRFVAEWALWML